jgi:hypothetical protein
VPRTSAVGDRLADHEADAVERQVRDRGVDRLAGEPHGDRERLGAQARLAELDRDHVVELVGGHRRDHQLVAAARRDLAHLVARQLLARNQDDAGRRVVRLDRARGLEPAGLGVDHDQRRLLFEEQRARVLGRRRDQELEVEALERRRGEVPQQLRVVRDQNLGHRRPRQRITRPVPRRSWEPPSAGARRAGSRSAR